MKAFVPLIAKCIRDRGETSVIKFTYTGEDGISSRRYASPYRFTNAHDEAFLALDLCDGELKHFKIDRCSEVVEFPANDVLIPMPMEVLE